MAQDPTSYEDIRGENALNEEEIESLRDEILHRWKQPWALYITIITCSIGYVSTGLSTCFSNPLTFVAIELPFKDGTKQVG